MLGTSKGVPFMIVPKDNYDEVYAGVWEKKEDEEYMKQSIRGASDFVDVMQLAVEGEWIDVVPITAACHLLTQELFAWLPLRLQACRWHGGSAGWLSCRVGLLCGFG